MKSQSKLEANKKNREPRNRTKPRLREGWELVKESVGLVSSDFVVLVFFLISSDLLLRFCGFRVFSSFLIYPRTICKPIDMFNNLSQTNRICFLENLDFAKEISSSIKMQFTRSQESKSQCQSRIKIIKDDEYTIRELNSCKKGINYNTEFAICKISHCRYY